MSQGEITLISTSSKLGGKHNVTGFKITTRRQGAITGTQKVKIVSASKNMDMKKMKFPSYAEWLTVKHRQRDGALSLSFVLGSTSPSG